MITLDYNIQSLMQEVERMADYVGGRSSDEPASYLRVAISEEDYPKLRMHLPEICSLLEIALREFKAVAQPDVLVVRVALHPINRWQSLHLAAVRKGIEAYLLNQLAAKWFAIVAPEFVAKHEEAAAAEIAGLTALLYHKAPPVKRTDAETEGCMVVQ